MKYPHLLPEEVILWDRFLALHKDEYLRFEYDIKVGGGQKLPAEKASEYKEMWNTLTRKRIDVIGFQPGKIIIFEIRRRPGMDCFGKALGYEDLYIEQFDPEEDVELAIVCNTLTKDMRFLFEKNNIKVYVV